MKKKIAACILAGMLGVTGVPMSVSAQQAASGNGTASVEAPEDEIRDQIRAMEQQEELEEEENMPAEDPDPLVLDDGNVVPASEASWTEETQDAGENDNAGQDEFSDGSADGTSAEAVADHAGTDNAENDNNTDADNIEESLTDDPENAAADSSEAAQPSAGQETVPETAETPETSETVEMAATGDAGTVQAAPPGETKETDGTGTAQDNAPEAQKNTDEAAGELQMETAGENKASRDAASAQALPEETEASDLEVQEDFSDGEASPGDLGTACQVETLDVEDGADITAPLNTLFLQLKDKATDETPYKIVIPPGNYELTDTLCMYSNMYLYARGATITKTSTTKHLILRLGNTKESEGGYDGYRNIVIDGGTWDYNYQCVEGKDEPGGFVGFCIGHANNVTFKNATFLNNLKSHFLEFGGVKNAKITNCTFHGYYKNYVEGGQECIQIDCCTDEGNVFPQYMPYDGTTCEDFVIDGNVFDDVFAGVGSHSMMSGKTYKRITVTNNTFSNVKKRCISFMNYEDSVAENNVMTNVGIGVDITAAGKNTHQTPGYTGGPDVVKDRNICVSGNYISLARTSNIGGIAWICSGVHIAGYNMKAQGVIPKGIYPVKGVTVEDNQISGYGNGISISFGDTSTITDNQIKVKKTSAYSNLGIYSQDSRKNTIQKNVVSGTANAGIYLSDSTYASGAGQKNFVSTNTVTGTGGDGIYLQSVNNTSSAEKNTVKSAGGSGIHVKSGKNISVISNICSSNKEHGTKIEYTAGGIRAKNNRLLSNGKSGILLWKAKTAEISGNRTEKNKGNGIYACASVIPVMKSNTFIGNAKNQALYAKDCKGWKSMDRPSFKTITAKSKTVTGTAAGSQNVTIYMVRSGKSVRLGAATVNKKKQFTVKIKPQKKNTPLRIVSKDRYGNAVTMDYKVK